GETGGLHFGHEFAIDLKDRSLVKVADIEVAKIRSPEVIGQRRRYTECRGGKKSFFKSVVIRALLVRLLKIKATRSHIGHERHIWDEAKRTRSDAARKISLGFDRSGLAHYSKGY